MKFELFHSAFENQPVLVATLETECDVMTALEQLYTATQNVDENWVKANGQFGIVVTPSPTVLAAGGARSTSVGDSITVHLDSGPINFRCSSVGWEPQVLSAQAPSL